ncbi:MAG: D-amino acid dehydrogenase [Steroidobacteraceae bacterium]
MRVIVLGAGVIGTTAAWYLNRAGHEVTVLERNAGAACETSFANAGQLSVSHAEPWANPAAPYKVLKWLGKEDAPLLFRLRADPAQWSWALKFLIACGAKRSARNMIQLAKLGTYSLACLREIRRETGIEYDQLGCGIMEFYTSQAAFDRALKPAEIMREMGCELRVIDADEVVRIEPAMVFIKPQLAGATYTSADESGDVYRFTTGLAQLAANQAVRFRYGVRIQRLLLAGGAIVGVELAGESGRYEVVQGDAYVLALGCSSRQIAREVGVGLDIYPAKGYSATLPILDADKAPSVSLTDDEYQLAFSRLGSRLRIAGTAELNGYNLALNSVRCQSIIRRTLELFPGVSNPELASYWAGLRPSTPGNLPYIGRSRVANLYLNTGHGTLGWTHACGSGRALAQILSGQKPEVDFEFCGLER